MDYCEIRYQDLFDGEPLRLHYVLHNGEWDCYCWRNSLDIHCGRHLIFNN